MLKRFSRTNVLLLLSVVLFLLAGVLILQYPYLPTMLRYQFAGIEDYKIFPSRIVKAADPQPWRLASDYNQAELDATLLEGIERYSPVAFLVIQDNEIVYERYWEDHTKDSYSSSFSMAKSIVGLLVGIALEEGKIESLDQPIADFLPEFAEGEKAPITFRHLLTMTSGLAWDEVYTSPLSPTTELYYGRQLYDFVVNLPLIHEPGSVWYYSSADTQILGSALEAAVGEPLNEYVSRHLWMPLGAEHDATWSMDREDGVIKYNCCFNSTPRDFAKLGQLVLQEGVWQGQMLVEADYVRESIQPFPNGVDQEGNLIDWYGYQFWVAPLDDGPVPHFAGILGQYIFILPELDAVVVRLGHRDDQDFQDGEIYLQAARSILENR